LYGIVQSYLSITLIFTLKYLTDYIVSKLILIYKIIVQKVIDWIS